MEASLFTRCGADAKDCYSGVNKMVRVLCLHGWGTNTEIFNYQFRVLRKHFPEVDFVVLQAPNEVPSPRDPTIENRFPGKYCAWYTTVTLQTGREFQGIEASLNFLRTHIENSPAYDGILSFSQGGSMAALILAMQNEGSFPGHFRFAVFVCPGFLPLHTLVKFLPRSLPTAFFLGQQDIFMVVGLALSRCFIKPIIHIHQSGHRFPSPTANVLSIFRDLFAEHKPKASL